jgi:hypothetical protein
MATTNALRYADGSLVDIIGKNDPRYSNATPRQTESYGAVNPYEALLAEQLPGTESYWRNLGFNGQTMTQATDQQDAQLTPELLAYIQSKGYQPGTDGGRAWNALLDSSGNVVQNSWYGNSTNDDAAFIAGMLGLGAAGYSANAAGLGVDAAGNATGGAFGSAAGNASPYTMTSADKAALYGDAGYGAGMTGAETGAAGGANLTGANMASNAGGTSLGDFFSGNGNWNDYLRAGQAAYGMYAQNKATDAASAGSAANLALQTRMYEENKALNQPLIDTRNSVLPQIQNLLANPSSITQDPGYQFQLKQGQNALNNRAAASGNYYSGQQMKAAQEWGQNFAGTKLDQSLNRLMGVATGTQVGANNAQQNAGNYAVAGGNALQQGGNIRAGGYIGQYNTVNNNINDWMQDQTNRKYWGGGG